MRIFVFGNINAGKTTAINKMIHLLPEYDVVTIDDVRRKHGDGTWDAEFDAQNAFVSSVEDNNNIFVECTGLGPLGNKLANGKAYKTDIVIHITSDLHQCLSRLDYKDLALTPYPDVTEPITATIERCHKEFERGDLEALWSDKVLAIFRIQSLNELDELPLLTIHHFSNIINRILDDPSVTTIMPYGSIATGTMSKNSDIDCYIVSSQSVDHFKQILAKTNSVLVDNIDNKLILYYQKGNVIELVVLPKLEGGIKYLIGSNINSFSNQCVKSTTNDRNLLDSIQYLSTKIVGDESKLVSEMIYFTYTLPRLLRDRNLYKYYFHFNILLHNYIRLNERLNGNTNKNYLPNTNIGNYQHLLIKSFEQLDEHFSLICINIQRLLLRMGSNYSTKYSKLIEELQHRNTQS